MPLYRYQCRECRQEFTRLVMREEKDEIKCEKCGSSRLEKLLPRFIMGRSKGGSSLGANSCSTCQASSCANCNLK